MFDIIIDNVFINGDYFHFNDLRKEDPKKQYDLINRWFVENYDSAPNSNVLSDSAKNDIVNPYDILIEKFYDVIDDSTINKLADDLQDNGRVWLTRFNDLMYWDDERVPDSYEIFQTSIDRIIEMKSKAYLMGGGDYQQHLFQILYANIFTSFEAYMVQAFINKVFETEDSLHQYLEKQKEFKFENPRLIDLLKGHDHINQLMENRKKEIKLELAKASWHDLMKVSTRFNCLDIDIKIASSGLYPVIHMRNDIVHRNGRTADDVPLNISENDLGEAIITVVILADKIRGHEKGLKNSI
ncbi:hypothetical protein [Aeromonas hydrophila]|uniref:hypothetical protein n=1 Tax=Aeromonas hydrophila TaxID=644 RepID=UPI00214EBFAF|nr:hypothetical protein [Aeromonas hydrophila]MCR3949935.1 hypothetical protein [Aeromonas hydrophila]MCW4617217.1 hypothetical protein [Aeromonas hydrophila]